MQDPYESVLTRDDTFFGVCEAIGEDFRFNPTWLRIALALGLFWSPVAVLGGYAAAGALVALSRWISPNPRQAAVEAQPETITVPAEVTAFEKAEPEELLAAA